MSELFDDDPRDERPERSSRRSRALLITAGVLVVAFFGLTTFASIYTDRLWYSSAGYTSVFSTLFWTKVGLFLLFGLLMAAVVAANIVIAFRLRPLFHPPSSEQNGLDRYREAVTPIRTWLVVGVALLLGVFAGTSGAGEWRNYLLWRNGVPFGRKDEYFNRDIGFYVFDLPWYHFLVDFAMAATIIALLASALVHYLYGGIRLQTPGDRLTGPAQAQLSVLLGLFVLAKGVDYWLDRFDLVSEKGRLLTGITYTDDHAVLPAKNILAGIAVICAILFFLNVWRRTWLLPSVGLALLVLSAILLGLIWPGIVQQFQVKPSEADKEESYIAKNIKATREAYSLEDVEPATLAASATKPDLSQLVSLSDSLPLVDPQLVRQTFEQKQQVRAYYSVAPVLDVDHYDIDGVDRAMVLGVRELDQGGIPGGDQNWSNLHTVYTHGNGIIAAFANQRDAENKVPRPDIYWAQGNEPGEDSLSEATGGFEDRVYFGEGSPDYSIVGKAKDSDPSVELNLAQGETEDDDASGSTTTYDGTGGVAVGSTWRQLMYAIKFGEPNFLLSGRVNSNSQVLYNRTPRERIEKVAPWLTIDDDAYPAVVNGRTVWILDGYTTTDRYPGSEVESFKTMTDDAQQDDTGLRTLPTDEINYMRNAVKATVDAYDGTVKLYEWDEDDPMLKAWEGAFPNTVLPKSAISDDLMAHLRYPEDLFKVQRYQYARYHVTDAGDFYQGNNRWEVPEDPNSANHLQPPYRMFVGDEEAASGDTWSMTSTFVPYRRSNLAAYVSVDSDAASADYGKMRVFEVEDQVKGPGQIANDFVSDPAVADAVAQFNRSGGQVLYGNLLTIPIAGKLAYVEPVYTLRPGATASNPLLTYVLVSYDGKVGIGSTLGESFSKILGVDNVVTPPDTDPGTPGDPNDPGPNLTVDQQIKAQLDLADEAFAAAKAALAEGDLATYAEQVDKAETAVAQALLLADERDGTTTSGDGGTPSDGTSPSSGATPSGDATPTDGASSEAGS